MRPKLPRALEWACIFYSAKIYDAAHRAPLSSDWDAGEMHGYRNIIRLTLKDCPITFQYCFIIIHNKDALGF